MVVRGGVQVAISGHDGQGDVCKLSKFKCKRKRSLSRDQQTFPA